MRYIISLFILLVLTGSAKNQKMYQSYHLIKYKCDTLRTPQLKKPSEKLLRELKKLEENEKKNIELQKKVRKLVQEKQGDNFYSYDR